MQLDIKEVEELAKTLYIRALKLLPRDIKQGFERLMREETDATGKTILGTMVENIAVAERTRNLLCQDTGIPIYNVTIGRHVEFDGAAMKAGDPPRLRARHHGTPAALVGGAPDHAQERADLVRHRRAADQYRFRRARRDGRDRDDPERLGLGERLVPADADPGRRRRRHQALRHRSRHRMRRPRLPADHRRRRHRRHLGPLHASRQGGGDAPARHHLLGRGRRQDRGAALAKRSTSSASARRG